jgi:hypothetical protein
MSELIKFDDLVPAYALDSNCVYSPDHSTAVVTENYFVYFVQPIDDPYGTFEAGKFSPRNELLREHRDVNTPSWSEAIRMQRMASAFDRAAEALGAEPDWRMPAPRFGAVPHYDGEYHLHFWAYRKLCNNGNCIIVSELPMFLRSPEGSTRLRAEFHYRIKDCKEVVAKIREMQKNSR